MEGKLQNKAETTQNANYKQGVEITENANTQTPKKKVSTPQQT